MLDKGLVFWCAFCNDKKPVQSLKAMVSHRGGGKQSCWRGSGKRNATIDAQRADGFLFFSEPPPPLPQQSTGSRGGRGAVGRGGRSGCRAGPGRGRKGKEAKAAEMAAKAAYLAAKYPGQSKMAEQAAASSSAGPSSSADDVEVLGEMTWAERDAELRSSAVDCTDALRVVHAAESGGRIRRPFRLRWGWGDTAHGARLSVGLGGCGSGSAAVDQKFLGDNVSLSVKVAGSGGV
eukprot:1400917-Prymnesium_polylepis.1